MNKGIKSGLISSAIILLTIAIAFYIFPIANTGWFSFHVHAQGAGPSEISCPNGSVPFTPIGQTFNNSSQKYRPWLCADANGNVIFNNGLNTSAPTGIQFWGGNSGFTTGTAITFCANASLPCNNIGSIGLGAGSVWQFTGSPTFSGAIILSSTIQYQSVLFASLGSVPSAGIAKYCSDCTTAATCAGSGSGHLAVSNGTNWTCQ